MSLLSLESLKPVRTTPAKAVLGLAQGLTRRVLGIAISWNHRRKLADLAGLDDRMLADLGLVRGDVAAAASEPLWRDATMRLSVLAVERRAAEREHARWRETKVAERRGAGQRDGRRFEVCAD